MEGQNLWSQIICMQSWDYFPQVWNYQDFQFICIQIKGISLYISCANSIKFTIINCILMSVQCKCMYKLKTRGVIEATK